MLRYKCVSRFNDQGFIFIFYLDFCHMVVVSMSNSKILNAKVAKGQLLNFFGCVSARACAPL